MKNGEVVLMMQQLSFSPVENILTVLFAAAILGYLLYLLVLTEQATGISYGESRKSLQQETGYRCESAGISGKRHGKFQSNRGGKRQDCHF